MTTTSTINCKFCGPHTPGENGCTGYPNFGEQTIEQRYMTAFENVLIAVGDCTKYISTSLRQEVDYLEARMTEQEIERLQRKVRGF